MPILGGLEVTRQIRGWSSVPILVLSVREDETDKIARNSDYWDAAAFMKQVGLMSI